MAFLGDITLGQFYPGNSFLHRLDSRTKILATLILMTCPLLSDQIWLLLVESVLCIIAVQVSSIPWKIITRNLKWFFCLFLITFGVHALDASLGSTFPFLSLSLSQGGLLLGLLFTLRLTLMIVYAALLTLTTTPIELTDGIEKMLTPLRRYRFPVHEFALMMTLTLRFIPILLREAERIRNAQLSRGVSVEGSLLERVRNVIPMLLPLLMSAIRKADDLATAMAARHYIGGEGRTHYRRMTLGPADLGVMMFSFAFLSAAVLLKWGQYI